MVDATKRPLQVPPRFIPYLEKHRIYGLFHHLTKQLLIRRPEDHILCLKEILTAEGKVWNKPKVILLAPPCVGILQKNTQQINNAQYPDKAHLAVLMSQQTGASVIKFEDIQFDTETGTTPGNLVKGLTKVLKTDPALSHGWILVDFPRTPEEAVIMKRAGVLPSHVLQFVISEQDKENTYFFCPGLEEKKLLEQEKEYYRNLRGLCYEFKHVLKECYIKEENMQQLALDCSALVHVMKHTGEPMLPRMVLIGPRGSGRITQARLLNERFKLVHVDCEQLIMQSLQQDGYLGNEVRRVQKNKLPLSHTILAKIIEERLLRQDCLEKGWVLTGYPACLEEFLALDSMETPPNRVILLDIDIKTCLKRITGRRINMLTGRQYFVDTITRQGRMLHLLKVHPRDKLDPENNEITAYFNNMVAMREYFEKTATVVDATQPVRAVFEMISATILRLPPPASPRKLIKK